MPSFIKALIFCLSAFSPQLSHTTLKINCKPQLLGFLSHSRICSVGGLCWQDEQGRRKSGRVSAGFLATCHFPGCCFYCLHALRGGHPPPSLGSPLVSQGWVFIQVLKASGPVGWTWTLSSLESFPLSLPRWKGK